MTFKEFKERFEPNLGRHSVDYHSWYTCDADTIEWLKDIYFNNEQKMKEFKKKRTVEIKIKNYHTGKEEVAKLTYNMGNIEEVIPFTKLPHHWIEMSLDKGFLSLPRYNMLLMEDGTKGDCTKTNNLSFVILDSDHWPALKRESIIIIREDVVE